MSILSAVDRCDKHCDFVAGYTVDRHQHPVDRATMIQQMQTQARGGATSLAISMTEVIRRMTAPGSMCCLTRYLTWVITRKSISSTLRTTS